MLYLVRPGRPGASASKLLMMPLSPHENLC